MAVANVEKILLSTLVAPTHEILQHQDKDASVIRLCDQIAAGDYLDVINFEFAADIFSGIDRETPCGTLEIVHMNIHEKIKIFLESSSNTETREAQILCVGVACLKLFVQLNWTGPPLSEISLPFSKMSVDLLEVDHEEPYGHLSSPALLIVATGIFKAMDLLAQHCQSCCWWLARCYRLHQQIISNNVVTLKEAIEKYYQETVKRFGEKKTDAAEYSECLTAGQAYLEAAIVSDVYWRHKDVEEYIKLAEEATGMESELKGALGKRTRYQTTAHSQMVVVAHSKDDLQEGKDGEMKSDTPDRSLFPSDMSLEDDTLLDHVNFSESQTLHRLQLVDQAILLGHCIDMKAQHPQGLAAEEISAYIDRVLSRPNASSIHKAALFLRSCIESREGHKQTRAIIQFEELFNHFIGAEPASQRQVGFFAIDIPPRWDQEKALADQYKRMGLTKSALDRYKSIHLLEEIILCLISVGRKSEAQEMLKEKLESDPSPKYWCILGDTTGDKAHYLQAWELSKETYSRAQRSLGDLALNRDQWSEAIEHYNLALPINPLFPKYWFSLGYSHMQLDQWTEAANAFTRCVSIEADDGQYWNNLAAVHLHLEDHKQAMSALEQSVRFKRGSWKIWDNYLSCAVKLGEVNKALTAMDRLLELRGSEGVDPQVLKLVVEIVLRCDEAKTDDDSGKLESSTVQFYLDRLERLLGKIASKVNTNPDIWDAYAYYYEGLDQLDKAIEFRQKQIRSIQVAGWERDEEQYSKLAEAIKSLFLVYSRVPQKKYVFSAKLLVNKTIKNAQKYLADHPANEELPGCFKDLEDAVKHIHQ